MKNIYNFSRGSLFMSSLFALGNITPALAQDFTPEIWTYDNGDQEYAMDVAIDSQGHTYVLAYSENGEQPATYTVLQYNQSGSVVRSILFDNGAAGSYATSLAVDADNNLYVTGARENGATNKDCLTVSYTDTGVVRWERTIDNNNRWESGNAIAVDGFGDIVVGGSSAVIEEGRTSSSLHLIGKYDADGNIVAGPDVHYFGSPATHRIEQIATDGSGNVYALGVWNTMPTYSLYKYDLNLQKVWQTNVGSLASDIVVDLDGNAFVASWDVASGNYDIKLSKYNTAGNFIDYGTYDNNSATMDRAYGMTMDRAGDIYVVGHADNRYLTLKFDAACDLVWPSPLLWDGPGYASWAVADAVDAAGNIYVAGTVGGEIIPTSSQHDVATVKYTNNGAPPSVTEPDLVITGVSGPTGAVNGEEITIANSVKNTGTDANSSFSVGIYLSTDRVITTDDTLIATRQVSSLSADSEDTANTAVTIPASVDYGSYYIGAVADSGDVIVEWNEYNNGGRGNEILISRPDPDLVMTDVSGPASAVNNGQMAISNTVVNQGVGINSSSSAALYLSTDQTIDAQDIYLGDRTVAPLNTSATDSDDTTVTVPASVDCGSYYVGAIADSGGAIAEWDEENNAAAGAPVLISLPSPDLIITALSGPATATQGASIDVSRTVTNQGVGYSPYDLVWIAYYLSTDDVITTDDTLIGHGFAPSIAACAEDVRSPTSAPVVPNSLADGTYYLGAIVDSSDALDEQNEDNNAFAGNTITIE